MNCSIGTEQFCVGFRNRQNLSCSYSPFGISALLPEAIEDLPGPVEDALRERMDDLSPLAGDLSSLPQSIDICIIVGTLAMSLVLVLSTYLLWDSCTRRNVGIKTRWLAYLAMAVLCCSPYLALVVSQSKVIKEAQGLPSWVEVQKGEVMGLSIGLLVCAAIFVALSAVVSSQVVVNWIRNGLDVRGNVRESTTRVEHRQPGAL
jgi:hypothetical protein